MVKSVYLVLNASVLFYLAGLDHYGLYVIISLFWIIAAFSKFLLNSALISVLVFMSGFALIHLLELILLSHFDVYSLGILFAETTMVMTGIYLIKYK